MIRLHALGLTAERFGQLTGNHAVTVRNWDKPRSGRGVQQTPAWAGLLLTAWETHPALIPPSHDDSLTPERGMNIGSGASFSRSSPSARSAS